MVIRFFLVYIFFCQLKNDLTLLTNPISSIAAVPAASAPGIGGGGVRRGGTEGTPTRGHPPPGHPPSGHPPPRHPPPGDSQTSLQQLAESPRRVAECRAVLKAAVAVGGISWRRCCAFERSQCRQPRDRGQSTKEGQGEYWG